MCADQARQAEVLLDGRRAHGHHVAVPYGLIDRPKLRLEPSQRSRVILHASLGAITALHLGADTLHIYENGVGALGLPFDETQSGWEVKPSQRLDPGEAAYLAALLPAPRKWNPRAPSPRLRARQERILRELPGAHWPE